MVGGDTGMNERDAVLLLGLLRTRCNRPRRRTAK
jgi:hypothetical protein